MEKFTTLKEVDEHIYESGILGALMKALRIEEEIAAPSDFYILIFIFDTIDNEEYICIMCIYTYYIFHISSMRKLPQGCQDEIFERAESWFAPS